MLIPGVLGGLLYVRKPTSSPLPQLEALPVYPAPGVVPLVVNTGLGPTWKTAPFPPELGKPEFPPAPVPIHSLKEAVKLLTAAPEVISLVINHCCSVWLTSFEMSNRQKVGLPGTLVTAV